MLLSIVIPCYNEENSIDELIDKSKFLTSNKSIEIIFINNGSTDNTGNLLRKHKAGLPNNIVVKDIIQNIGYGFGIKTGLKIARGKYVGWTHSDLQTDLLDVYDCIKLLNKESEKYLIIKGSRKNRKILEKIFSFSMEVFFSIIFLCNLKEINAQPSIYHRKVLDFVSSAPNDYLFDTFMYVVSKKLLFKELRIPVFFKSRVHGKSHWNFGIIALVKFSLMNIIYSFKLRNFIKKRSDLKLLKIDK